jgi:hypothetical protein
MRLEEYLSLFTTTKFMFNFLHFFVLTNYYCGLRLHSPHVIRIIAYIQPDK